MCALPSEVDIAVVASDTADRPSNESRATCVGPLAPPLALAPRALGVAALAALACVSAARNGLGVEDDGSSSEVALPAEARVGVAAAEAFLWPAKLALDSPLLGVEGDMMLGGSTLVALALALACDAEAVDGLASSDVGSASVTLVSLVGASVLVLWMLLAPELSSEMGGGC